MNTISFNSIYTSEYVDSLNCTISSKHVSEMDDFLMPEIADFAAMNAITEAIERELGEGYEVRITHNNMEYAYHIHADEFCYSDCFDDYVCDWIDEISEGSKPQPISFDIDLPCAIKVNDEFAA